MNTNNYLTPECQIIEMYMEGNILTGSDVIGGGGDGEMEEGGEI